jgi:hypothetical protein
MYAEDMNGNLASGSKPVPQIVITQCEDVAERPPRSKRRLLSGLKCLFCGDIDVDDEEMTEHHRCRYYEPPGANPTPFEFTTTTPVL